jgi:hypothetical protein
VIRLNGGVLPRFCTAELSRHGRLCVYFRMVGRTGRIRLRAEPETPAFYTAYAALLSGSRFRTSLLSLERAVAKPRTWRWLCERYFQSISYRTLQSAGQRIRRRQLEATYSEPISPGSALTFGDCPVEKFTSRAVRVLRDRKVRWIAGQEGENNRTNLEAANSLLKYIRGVLAFAKEEHSDLVERNHALDVDYFKSASYGITVGRLTRSRSSRRGTLSGQRHAHRA